VAGWDRLMYYTNGCLTCLDNTIGVEFNGTIDLTMSVMNDVQTNLSNSQIAY